MHESILYIMKYFFEFYVNVTYNCMVSNSNLLEEGCKMVNRVVLIKK